jgi:tRNA modification GTPase
MQSLLATADLGRLYREGTSVAIAGRPNVGKSSLFNALLRESRAIVTEQAGTTRDLIQEIITIHGIPVRLIDMAGLRESHDVVERIGIEYARNALRNAALVLFVVDGAEPICDDDHALANELAQLDVPFMLVINKLDLPQRFDANTLEHANTVCRISAQSGEGLATLESAMHNIITRGQTVATDEGMLTRAHQKDSLRRALDAVQRLLDHFDASPEFLSIDLNDALKALGEITGETTPDEILDRIFASFCIGK